MQSLIIFIMTGRQKPWRNPLNVTSLCECCHLYPTNCAAAIFPRGGKRGIILCLTQIWSRPESGEDECQVPSIHPLLHLFLFPPITSFYPGYTDRWMESERGERKHGDVNLRVMRRPFFTSVMYLCSTRCLGRCARGWHNPGFLLVIRKISSWGKFSQVGISKNYSRQKLLVRRCSNPCNRDIFMVPSVPRTHKRNKCYSWLRMAAWSSLFCSVSGSPTDKCLH